MNTLKFQHGNTAPYSIPQLTKAAAETRNEDGEEENLEDDMSRPPGGAEKSGFENN